MVYIQHKKLLSDASLDTSLERQQNSEVGGLGYK